ncbi:type IV pilin protein [Aeromonas ichthyocola]
MIGYFRGFSLIELMIVVRHCGDSWHHRLPAYQQYVLTSHRVEAKKPCCSMRPIGKKPILWISISMHPLLLLLVSVVRLRMVCINYPSAVSGNTYTLSASAGATTAQANDTDCTVFSINQLGVKSASGAASNSCWE